MHKSTLAAAAASALASTLVLAGAPAAKSHSTSTASQAALPEVVIRTARVTTAVEGYLGALSIHDSAGLSRFFTDDAVVEFVSDEPGAALSFHADSLLDGTTPVAGGVPQQAIGLRVLPTADSSAVFVQYKLAAADERSQVALVEMHGDKISRMVNFNAPPASLARTSACVTPHNVVAAADLGHNRPHGREE